MLNLKIKLLLLTFMCFSSIAFAAPTVFFDDFNSENGGVGALNYTGFANWAVSDGTVDLIGNGYYDFLPGNGLYIDMDGSTFNSGIMTSNIFLAEGTYILSFELAGNHRNNSPESVNVQVGLGSLFNDTFSLNQNDPFTLIERTITVAVDTTVALSFAGIGGDNIGMLLDDVSITAVPVPGAFLLGGIGVSFVGWMKRRRSL